MYWSTRTLNYQGDVISRLLPIKEDSGLVKNTDALLVARNEDGVDEYALIGRITVAGEKKW